MVMMMMMTMMIMRSRRRRMRRRRRKLALTHIPDPNRPTRWGIFYRAMLCKSLFTNNMVDDKKQRKITKKHLN